MRALFYYTAHRWTGSARAFAVAARGLAAQGEPVTVVCCADTPAEQAFAREGIEVVGAPAWRLRRRRRLAAAQGAARAVRRGRLPPHRARAARRQLGDANGRARRGDPAHPGAARSRRTVVRAARRKDGVGAAALRHRRGSRAHAGRVGGVRRAARRGRRRRWTASAPRRGRASASSMDTQLIVCVTGRRGARARGHRAAHARAARRAASRPAARARGPGCGSRRTCTCTPPRSA